MGEIERNEVIAVALLALGVLLFANPAYTQGQSGSAASVQVAQEIQPETLTLQNIPQINQELTTVPVIEYERLSGEARSIFDTGRQGIYLIRNESDAENAVLQSGVLYRDSVYLRQTQETQQGLELRYQEVSDDIGTNLMGTSLMSPEQLDKFKNATEAGSEGVNLTSVDAGLSAYDYVYDNETRTYYETSIRNGNQTLLSVTEVEPTELIDPAFDDTSEMSGEKREVVVGAIEGEEPVVSGDLLSEVQSSQLVRHEGSYYQIGFAEASVPITEALGPSNFAAMGLGILLILSGGYLVRRIYVEKT